MVIQTIHDNNCYVSCYRDHIAFITAIVPSKSSIADRNYTADTILLSK